MDERSSHKPPRTEAMESKSYTPHELGNLKIIDQILVSGTEAQRNQLQEQYRLTPEQMDRFTHFATMRENMHREAYLGAKERKALNPEKTEEELKLGVYLESIEPHVQGAVLVLNRKGYKTYESGFYGHDGQQVIGFQPDSIPDLSKIPETLLTELREQGFPVLLKGGKLQFTPEHIATEDELKRVWDRIAEAIPSFYET